MRNTKEAFHWIIFLLRKNKIPFRISGGLAARVYGSRRKLADIDIDMNEKYFKKIIPDIKKFIVAGPNRYIDDNWNIEAITLRYKNQEIDLCGISQTFIFSQQNKKWIKLSARFHHNKNKTIYGLKVPVQNKKDLIAYKKELARAVDRIDVSQLEKQ